MDNIITIWYQLLYEKCGYPSLIYNSFVYRHLIMLCLIIFVLVCHYNFFYQLSGMINSLVVLVCLVFVIWFTVTKIKKKLYPPRLAIIRQLSYSYSKQNDDNQKRKKPKKVKKKHKKNQHTQILTYQQDVDNEEQIGEQSQKQAVSNGKDQNEEDSSANKPKPKMEEDMLNRTILDQDSPQQQLAKIGNIQASLIVEQAYSHCKNKDIVIQQIQLLMNYFMDDLQEIVPYNGKYGHYKLVMEGSKKMLTLQWIYHERYPDEQIQMTICKESLNPLETQSFNKIIEQHQLKSKSINKYFFIFNLTTSLYQDLMICIHFDPEQQKLQELSPQNLQINGSSTINQEFDLTRPHNKPEDIKAKKQIYGKILDQIFYLHDMVEKPDTSSLKINQQLQQKKTKQRNSRGRYESEFEELELIGEGGFGKVYKVRHKLDGNIYAIKKAVVNYEDLNDRKILKEVALLSKLNHPNIVRYYQSWLEDASTMDDIKSDMSFSENDNSKIEQLNRIYNQWKKDRSVIKFGENSQSSYNGSIIQNSQIVFEYQDDNGIVFQNEEGEEMESEGSSINYTNNQGKNSSNTSLIDGLHGFPFKILYIAMELCTGINLRQFINHHFDEEQQKIQILRGILQGLAYIHLKKIIHRDLKPANIFLTDQNKVKIGDFGLATSEERSISISLEIDESDFFNDKTKAVGTGFYRAPEQLKSKKYDEKVDIYSLGIIMFELFYHFQTAMQRMQVLKKLTQTHKLPKDFQISRIESDLPENISVCLQENSQKRPSASKLLESFRNKYFTQLVSCIANPKHFQFSQLLSHLFAIKNDYGAPFMRRDAYKAYITSKIIKIYQIHRGTHFPTLPFLPIQDFKNLNGKRIKANRNEKYLLLTNKGNILEYASNCLKSWLKYAKDAMKKKKTLEDQRQVIRRFTFEKIINWQGNDQRRQESQIQFSEKMVTAFDITYKYQDGFNAFYLCQALKISESIVLTLNLTQKRPPIYLSHSKIFILLAEKFKIPIQTFYGAILSINQNEFYQLPQAKKINYFQQKNIPFNFAKKLCTLFDQIFEKGVDMIKALQLQGQSQILRQIQGEILEVQKIKKNIINNTLKWKIGIPPSNCNGFFWEVGIVKGLTSIEQYMPPDHFCNYHIETNLDQEPQQEANVSLWCIGQYLEDQIQRLIAECWRHGLAAKWYEWQFGEKEDKCRHNIILKRKNERVQVMVRHNQLKKGELRQQKESAFLQLQNFKVDVIKQMENYINPNYYH